MRIFAWFARSRVWVITEQGTPLWNSPCWDADLGKQLVGYTTRVSHMMWDDLVGENEWNLFWIDEEILRSYDLQAEWLHAKKECWVFVLKDIALNKASVDRQAVLARTALAQSSAIRMEVMNSGLSEFAKATLVEMCEGAVINASAALGALLQRQEAMEKDAKEWKEVVGPDSWKRMV